ncbi:MAG: hypothetical protein HYY41_00350 [Chloroflexi bacterium]|nr:hypothetical protein [Chloroflexota bacterium]MBI2979277.1 hypothetical protein [Chloroflexota bacterium]
MKRAKITEQLAYGTALDRLTGTAKPTVAPSREVPPVTAEVTMIKLSVFLNRQEDAYLETLSATAKFSGGKKVSKTRLIETMVRAFSSTDLDVRGVKDDEELYKRVIAQLRIRVNA